LTVKIAAPPVLARVDPLFAVEIAGKAASATTAMVIEPKAAPLPEEDNLRPEFKSAISIPYW
jgi:hypothetical protein